MALTIIIQAQDHTETSRYSDDPEGTLARLCSGAPQRLLVRGIHPHADTMFNTYQLGLIIDEIDAMSVSDPVEKRAWDELREAAMTAVRQRGYLWFNGD